ncbi:MAG TPA: plastocyanin/azurin family copper-binding protein [Mycobacteriales bacterium]|nr:plastocyanin/azurin family copper-binding protein [Mycobacteriales bacterium]
MHRLTLVPAVLLPMLLVTACGGGDDDAAPGAAREIAVTANDELRFDPAAISAKPGEKVVIVVSNTGRIDHELVIGDAAYLDGHAEGGEHEGHADADGGASVAVAAGKTARLAFTMPKDVAPTYACFVDRHDKAGMTGTVTYT